MRHLLCLCVLLTLQLNARAAPPADEFVASSPCDPHVRTFLGIAQKVGCERITWQLTLSQTDTTYVPVCLR